MKRVVCLFLTVTLVISVFSGLGISANGAEYITSASDIKGSMYSRAVNLPETLNKIFKGDIDVFSDKACQKEISMPLGYKIDTSASYYIKNKTNSVVTYGMQCYIYANAVYNKLFNEYIYRGENLDHSEIVVKGGIDTLSYNTLYRADVRTGAYMRTTDSKTGKYNGSVGHSMIILSYDIDGITILEGNADGKGLVRITKRTWDEFNSSQLSGKKRCLAHIVQPTEEYYDNLYKPYVIPTVKVSKNNIKLALNSLNTGSFYITCGGTYKSVSYTKESPFYDITSTSKSGNTYIFKIKAKAYGEDAFILNLKDTDGVACATAVVKISVGEENEVYTISYNANGGTNPPESTKKKHGETINLTKDKPTGKAYTITFDPNGGTSSVETKSYKNVFASWNTVKTGKGTSYLSGGKINENKNTTLYAIWKNAPFGKPEEPEKLAYNFLGWYTSNEKKEDGTPAGTLYNEETPVKKNVTLYAMWEINEEEYNDPDFWWEHNKTKTVPLKSAVNHHKGVNVSWSELKGAEKYIVYRKTSASSWKRVGTADSTKRSFVDTTAESNNKYIYTVKAQNGKEYSKYSKTGVTVKYIAAPTVTVSNATAGVTIKWNKVAGGAKYYVYRKTTGAWTRLDVITKNSFTDKTAKSGVTYYYTVRAGNNGIASSAAASKKIVRLSTPSLTSLKAEKGKNTLAFAKVSGAQKYTVYRKTGSSGWSLIATTTATTCVDKKVKTGTYYTYTVRAVKGTDRSYFNTKGLKAKAK